LKANTASFSSDIVHSASTGSKYFPELADPSSRFRRLHLHFLGCQAKDMATSFSSIQPPSKPRRNARRFARRPTQ
jgi:hypothetical protein